MRTLYLSFAVLCAAYSNAQVSITSSDLPNANDVLVTRSAQLLNPQLDLEFTGPNQTWNFGFDVLQPLTNVNFVDCVPVSSTPFLYQFLFNNPFSPNYDSDFAFGTDDISVGLFTFEDVFAYFQNNDNRYAATGVGATINGIPVPAQYNPLDIVYQLPIAYGNQDTSYSELNLDLDTLGAYHLEQTRVNVVTGWGTLNIYGQTFPVLKVRTEIAATDSVYIGFLGFGQALERPLAIEYKWLCPAFNVPVLQINANVIAGEPVVTSVATADIYVGVEEHTKQQWVVYPNPSENHIFLSESVSANTPYSVWNAMGQKVAEGIWNAQGLSIEDWSAGHYFLMLQSGETWKSLPFVKSE
jgi:hypothetical protein